MAIAVCSVTGRIAGDADACGDCDPCILGEAAIPEVVKRLLAEKEEWRQKYCDLCVELDLLRMTPEEREFAINGQERW